MTYKDLSNIVYTAITKWKNNPRFAKYELKNYDNWKDDLIDRIWNKIKYGKEKTK